MSHNYSSVRIPRLDTSESIRRNQYFGEIKQKKLPTNLRFPLRKSHVTKYSHKSHKSLVVQRYWMLGIGTNFWVLGLLAVRVYSRDWAYVGQRNHSRSLAVNSPLPTARLAAGWALWLGPGPGPVLPWQLDSSLLAAQRWVSARQGTSARKIWETSSVNVSASLPDLWVAGAGQALICGH